MLPPIFVSCALPLFREPCRIAALKYLLFLSVAVRGSRRLRGFAGAAVGRPGVVRSGRAVRRRLLLVYYHRNSMKIVTYNVNGIRSAIGKGLCDWIADERPVVLCLQETKAQPEQIPSEAFERMGYRCHYFSAVKKGYSGVAILTLCEPDRVVPGMGIER